MTTHRSTPLSPEDEASLRPRDPRTGEPLPQNPHPGYYPRFSTLDQKAYWEDATRKVVLDRVHNPPERRFFTEDQWRFWDVVFSHIIPQFDRTLDRRVPLIPQLDKRLHANRTAGYRFEDIVPDREVYVPRGIDAINSEANALFHADFLNLSFNNQDRVLESIHSEHPKSSPDVWKELSPKRFWQMITGDAVEAYYAHPWAWDEVGFGGPAYPRAYTRLERGEPEPWEVREKRYDWIAPTASISDNVHIKPEVPTNQERHLPDTREPQP